MAYIGLILGNVCLIVNFFSKLQPVFLVIFLTVWFFFFQFLTHTSLKATYNLNKIDLILHLYYILQIFFILSNLTVIYIFPLIESGKNMSCSNECNRITIQLRKLLTFIAFLLHTILDDFQFIFLF